MIELNNVSLIFNQGTPLENPALQRISFKVFNGDFITLIGGNGAGKSTLLSVLAGEFLPSQGQIVLDNMDVTKKTTDERSSLISRVFQDPRIGTCEEMTIEENLAFAASRGEKRGLRLASNTQLRKKFRSLLIELGMGLENRLHDRVGLLSGGQRQALSLVMATLKPAKILLLDEHTAALDMKTAEKILSLTETIIKQYHLTTIMVTHHLKQALTMGNRTILLQEGKVIKELKQDERTEAYLPSLLEFL